MAARGRWLAAALLAAAPAAAFEVGAEPLELSWYTTPPQKAWGAWCDTPSLWPEAPAPNASWVPLHLVALPGGRLWALGLRRSDVSHGVPRGDVLASDDGGVTWRCASRTNAVVRAGATAFAVANTSAATPPLLCVAGGRRLQNMSSGGFASDPAGLAAAEVAGVYEPPTDSVVCSADGGVSWAASAPLPRATFGATCVTVPLGARRPSPVLVGGLSKDRLWGMLVPRVVESAGGVMQVGGWSTLASNAGTGSSDDYFNRMGLLATWLPATRTVMLAGGESREILTERLLVDPIPASTIDLSTGFMLGLTLPRIDAFFVDLQEYHFEGNDSTIGVNRAQTLPMLPAARFASDARVLPRSFALTAIAIAGARPRDLLLHFADGRTFLYVYDAAVPVQPDAKYRSLVNLIPAPAGSSAAYLPSPWVPASALATPQWADPRFGPVLAADPRSGQLIRASPVRCQPPAACAAGVGYSGACTASPFDAPCLRCRACRAGQDFVSTACSAQADAVCAPCPPCAAGLSVLVACCAPGAPANEHVCGVPPRAGDLLLLQPRELVIVGSVVGVEAVLACALLAGLLWRRRREAAAVGEAPARRETQRDWQGASSRSAAESGISGGSASVRQRRSLFFVCSVAGVFTTACAATLLLALAVSGFVGGRRVDGNVVLRSATILVALSMGPAAAWWFIARRGMGDPKLRVQGTLASIWAASPCPVVLFCAAPWRPQLLLHAHAAALACQRDDGDGSAAGPRSTAPTVTALTSAQQAAVRGCLLVHAALVDTPLLAAALSYLFEMRSIITTSGPGHGSSAAALMPPIVAFTLQLCHQCTSLYFIGVVRPAPSLLHADDECAPHHAVASGAAAAEWDNALRVSRASHHNGTATLQQPVLDECGLSPHHPGRASRGALIVLGDDGGQHGDAARRLTSLLRRADDPVVPPGVGGGPALGDEPHVLPPATEGASPRAATTITTSAAGNLGPCASGSADANLELLERMTASGRAVVF